MRTLTVRFAVALALLGAIGFLMSGAASPTALIPAFFAVPLFILGRLSDEMPTAGRLALVLAVVGLMGAARGLPLLGAVMDGTALRPLAVVSQSIMAVLCVAYIGLWLMRRPWGDRAGATG